MEEILNQLANIAPAERILVVGQPDRILFLVVDDDLVYCDETPAQTTFVVWPPFKLIYLATPEPICHG